MRVIREIGAAHRLNRHMPPFLADFLDAVLPHICKALQAASHFVHPPNICCAAGHLVDIEVRQRDHFRPDRAVFALRHQIAEILPLCDHYVTHFRKDKRVDWMIRAVMAQCKAVDFPRFRIRQLKAVFRPRERRQSAPVRRLIDGGRRDNNTLPTVCALFRSNQLIVIAALHDDARAILLPRIIIRQMIIVVIIIRVRHKRHQGLGQAPAVRGGNRHYHHHQGQNQQNPPFLHRSHLLWRYFPTYINASRRNFPAKCQKS